MSESELNFSLGSSEGGAITVPNPWDSKDIMVSVLKFPIAWWLYDPVNKNNTAI